MDDFKKVIEYTQELRNANPSDGRYVGRRWILSTEVQDQNLQSNQQIKEIHGHKLILPDYYFLISIYDHYEHRRKWAKRVNLKRYNSDTLLKSIKNKSIPWYTPLHLSSIPGIKWPVVLVQPKPLIVLDIDVPYDEVCRKIRKWHLYGNYPIIVVKSTSGNAHIYLWADISSVPDMHDTRKINIYQLHEYYKSTYRYIVYMKIKGWLAETLEKDTELTVDKNTLLRDHIAWTPQEVAHVRFAFININPAVIPMNLIGENKFMIIAQNARYYNKLQPFFKELKSFLASPECCKEVQDYVNKYIGVAGKSEYYLAVRKWLAKNLNEIHRSWTQRYRTLWYLRMPNRQMGIGHDQAAELFNCGGSKLSTYARHFLCYMLSLKSAQQYVAHKKVDEFIFQTEPMKKFFKTEFLLTNWFFSKKPDQPVHIEISPKILSEKLGSGNTYNTLCRYIPYIYRSSGNDRTYTKTLVVDAIKLSRANNKLERIKWVSSYLSILDKRRKKGL